MSPVEGKQELRRRALARRKLIEADARTQAGVRLADCLHALPLPERGGTVAAYLSMGAEIEMEPLLEALLREGYRLLVPRLGSGLEVGWGAMSGHGAMARLVDCGARRPREPQGETLPPEALRQAGMILVPALMVDAHGTRLGRGGGWYDRALMHRTEGTPVIAVCWPWEAGCAALPCETHDLPVDGMLTPEGCRFVERDGPAVTPTTRI